MEHKTGRPPKIPEELSIRIRTKLLESKQGCTTKQVWEMISRESAVIYHHIHIYRILHKWGFKQQVLIKRHINTASVKEQKDFKKEKKILDTLTDEFTAVSLDESFFFYDSLVRRVWIYKDIRPVVNVAGSYFVTGDSLYSYQMVDR